MQVRLDIDVGAVMGRVEEMRGAAIWGASEQALTDCNAYVLVDQGTLRASSLTHSDTENGRLIWATPYARRRYYTGRPKRGKNPDASLRWAQKAKELHVDDWRLAAEKAMGKAR